MSGASTRRRKPRVCFGIVQNRLYSIAFWEMTSEKRQMTLQLVLDEGEWGVTIPIEIERLIVDALKIQLACAEAQGTQHAFIAKLSLCFVSALGESMDIDLREPSKAQINFAIAIAKDLSIALPGEALRYRGAMKAFLDRFSDPYRNSRAMSTRNSD